MTELIHKSWDELERSYSWVADMRGVPQDPVHHAEGDVATHTQMVLDALTKLPDYQHLSQPEKEILWVAALLHDVEKRSTTAQEPDGSIVSPGHAKKGALSARRILFQDFNLPFDTREQIVGLVSHHGLPLWLFYKGNPQKALLRASFEVNHKLVAILAKADVFGRICRDQQELLDRIGLFEEYCKEQHCVTRPYSFASDLARYQYFHSESRSPEYEPFDDTLCQVTVMSGLPGMGKDNYIKKHFADQPVISLDEIRRLNKIKPEDSAANGWVAQHAKEQARICLRKKVDFVWNATNICMQMRSQLIELFTSYRARVKIVYVEQPFKQWRNQNASREAIVPNAVLDRMLSKWEVPKLHEAHSVTYVIPSSDSNMYPGNFIVEPEWPS